MPWELLFGVSAFVFAAFIAIGAVLDARRSGPRRRISQQAIYEMYRHSGLDNPFSMKSFGNDSGGAEENTRKSA